MQHPARPEPPHAWLIPKPPARNLPGSSNLSLLTGASLFDPAHVEKGELPETVTVGRVTTAGPEMPSAVPTASAHA